MLQNKSHYVTDVIFKIDITKFKLINYFYAVYSISQIFYKFLTVIPTMILINDTSQKTGNDNDQYLSFAWTTSKYLKIFHGCPPICTYKRKLGSEYSFQDVKFWSYKEQGGFGE